MSRHLENVTRLRLGGDDSGKARFVNHTGVEPAVRNDGWTPMVVTQEEIAAEADRLSALPRPGDGRRRSLIVHPRDSFGLGLTPGIQVALEVLLPGERTRAIRHNSAQVLCCVEGGGTVVLAGGPRVVRPFERNDVWNTPSMVTYVHINDTPSRQVRLVYSNAALLERIDMHYVDEDPGKHLTMAPDNMSLGRPADRSMQESPASMWSWRQLKSDLDSHAAGRGYLGGRLDHGFSASVARLAAGAVDSPYSHIGAVLTYFFQGSGTSIVDGCRYAWKAGDLQMWGPGRAVQSFAGYESDVCELTIQDGIFRQGGDSALWHETTLMRLQSQIGSCRCCQLIGARQ